MESGLGKGLGEAQRGSHCKSTSFQLKRIDPVSCKPRGDFGNSLWCGRSDCGDFFGGKELTVVSQSPHRCLSDRVKLSGVAAVDRLSSSRCSHPSVRRGAWWIPALLTVRTCPGLTDNGKRLVFRNSVGKTRPGLKRPVVDRPDGML